MPVVGTAGHVDHGKSTLVQALTGRDPDRWSEEKERGLTIDLGFAWTTLPSGTEISFVDVPGHERFIKNMLAGTDGFDVALFVVAADEGWMPQSEEHLAVLDLLGVRHAVVALTKIDRVDDELAELATLDVTEHLEGTALENAPVIPVSAIDATGIDELRAALDDAIVTAGDARHRGRPRLWIDRAFTISGAGTVVTGTLTGGSLRVGDKIEIQPGPHQGRIRSVQSHEQSRDEALAGTRVAVNVVGLERAEVFRGSMLGRPGDWLAEDRILVGLERARYVEEPLTNRGAYHVHLGSGAWPARLRAVGGTIDGTELAVLQFDSPIPVAFGDRFILREVGRRAIVAGGRVLEPRAPKRSADSAAVGELLLGLLEAEPDEIAGALLDHRTMASLDTLAAHSGGGRPQGALIAGDRAISSGAADSITRRARSAVRAFQEQNPLRPGMPRASLASAMGIDQESIDVILAGDEELRIDGSTVATADFQTGISDADESRFAGAAEAIGADGLNVPRVRDLGLSDELVHLLVREGRLIRISDDFAYLPEQVVEIDTALAGLPDPFTVADFRDALGVSRKYAVPLLEWLDRRGATVRRGDVRSVRR